MSMVCQLSPLCDIVEENGYVHSKNHETRDLNRVSERVKLLKVALKVALKHEYSINIQVSE